MSILRFFEMGIDFQSGRLYTDCVDRNAIITTLTEALTTGEGNLIDSGQPTLIGERSRRWSAVWFAGLCARFSVVGRDAIEDFRQTLPAASVVAMRKENQR
jgi:hypothetical protein